MVLSRLQRLRFFKLLDPLTVYANTVLDVVDERELLDGKHRDLDEGSQALVAQELWQNLDVIDSFVRENPTGFTSSELDIVKSWRDGLNANFIWWRFSDGIGRLMGDGYAFEVCGLTTEIEDAFAHAPTIAQTVLLPFDGLIVYNTSIGMHDINIGDGLVDVFRELADEIEREGLFVSSADGLMRAAGEIREREIEREAEQIIRDLEEEQLRDEPGRGQHRGVLADMSDEERDQAIDAHLRESLRAGGFTPVNTLLNWCTPGPLATGIDELLAREELPDPALDFEDIMQEMKDQLADPTDYGEYSEQVAEEAAKLMAELESYQELSPVELLTRQITDPQALQDVLGEAPLVELLPLKKLYEAGGRLTIAESDVGSVKSINDLPRPLRGISHVFHDERARTFIFIMTDEALESCKSIDWDALVKTAQDRQELVRFFDYLAELRGITPYSLAIDDYLDTHPDGFQTVEEVVDELARAIEDDATSACVLDDGEIPYVLHYELVWAWRDARGLDPYDMDALEEGPLGTLLEGLLAAQTGKDPRLPTPEMLAYDSLFSWKEAQPCCRAMRSFLDAHVPDVRDDLLFADKVMEQLIDETKWGADNESVRTLFNILDESDFEPEEHHLQTLLNMWANMGNALPVWPNNGWSPNELLSMSSGHTVFYNEDGSVMKVGRNDPCPCGSGKKYKKCHGR